MKKNLAGTALIMLALLACASTRLFAGTNGLQAAGRAALAAEHIAFRFCEKGDRRGSPTSSPCSRAPGMN